MARFPFRLVTFDLDGTLTTEHGWLEIARATGTLAAFERTQRAFRAREVDEDTHLNDLLALAEGFRVTEIEEVLARTPKVAGIPATLSALHEDGVRLALLTHNPDYVCAWYARTYGFDDYEGTNGRRVRAGRIVPDGPAHAGKIEGLDRLRARSKIAAGAVAHVGDGWADAAVFPHVGYGIAFRSGRPEVRRAADAVVDGSDLTALLAVLEAARPRRPVNDAPPLR